MKRKQSKNPNRTEKNKDLFDYMEGKFSVKLGDYIAASFLYTGNNMQESTENRKQAKNDAEEYAKIMSKFIAIPITIVEEDL